MKQSLPVLLAIALAWLMDTPCDRCHQVCEKQWEACIQQWKTCEAGCKEMELHCSIGVTHRSLVDCMDGPRPLMAFRCVPVPVRAPWTGVMYVLACREAPYDPECANRDFDDSGDIDLRDWARQFGGLRPGEVDPLEGE